MTCSKSRSLYFLLILLLISCSKTKDEEPVYPLPDRSDFKKQGDLSQITYEDVLISGTKVNFKVPPGFEHKQKDTSLLVTAKPRSEGGFQSSIQIDFLGPLDNTKSRLFTQLLKAGYFTSYRSAGAADFSQGRFFGRPVISYGVFNSGAIKSDIHFLFHPQGFFKITVEQQARDFELIEKSLRASFKNKDLPFIYSIFNLQVPYAFDLEGSFGVTLPEELIAKERKFQELCVFLLPNPQYFLGYHNSIQNIYSSRDYWRGIYQNSYFPGPSHFFESLVEGGGPAALEICSREKVKDQFLFRGTDLPLDFLPFTSYFSFLAEGKDAKGKVHTLFLPTADLSLKNLWGFKQTFRPQKVEEFINPYPQRNYELDDYYPIGMIPRSSEIFRYVHPEINNRLFDSWGDEGSYFQLEKSQLEKTPQGFKLGIMAKVFLPHNILIDTENKNRTCLLLQELNPKDDYSFDPQFQFLCPHFEAQLLKVRETGVEETKKVGEWDFKFSVILPSKLEQKYWALNTIPVPVTQHLNYFSKFSFILDLVEGQILDEE